MDRFMIAFLLVLGLIFLSRIINEKANKKLTTEKKLELYDLFSKNRIYTFGILIGIIILFFASMKFSLLDPTTSFILYIFLVLSFLAISGYSSYKKLKEHDFPDFYIKSYLLTTSIRFLGIVIFFALIDV